MARTLVYQTFCGRAESANLRDHQGAVFARLSQRPWADLKRTGFDVVYLLGVWDNRGPIVVNEEAGQDIRFQPDRYASPFAVVNHARPNPDLGSTDDLKYLIETIHQAGLRVIADFIPNHTGITHPWVKAHPEFYKSTARAFSGDVYELNYDNALLSQEMIQVMETNLHLGLDGFRVDMAHLIPLAFWEHSISYLKLQFPQTMFLAEAYSASVFDLTIQEQLIQAGFDAVYDEPLYRNLKKYTDQIDVEALVGHLTYIRSHPAATSWCHYLENHDDNFPLPAQYVYPLQVLLLALPGWQFVYEGLLLGKTNRLAHHWLELLDDAHTDLVALDARYTDFVTWIKANDPEIRSINRIGAKLTVSFAGFPQQLHVDLSSGHPDWWFTSG